MISMYNDVTMHTETDITTLPKDTPVAMAIVPMQHYKGVYPADEGFDKGTIFPELDLPFLGERRFENE